MCGYISGSAKYRDRVAMLKPVNFLKTAGRYQRSIRGNMAVLFAMLAPIILGFSGAAIDVGRYLALQADLQEIADASAITGARQYIISVESQTPRAVAQNAAEVGLANAGIVGALVTTGADDRNSIVEISLDFEWRPTFFTSLIRNPLSVSVYSRAEALSGQNICVLSLKEDGDRAIELSGMGTISAPSCGVFANSGDPKAISSSQNAQLRSAITCSAGGYDGGVNNFDPTPISDCPGFDDPLADRLPPATPSYCDHSSIVEISGASQVTLSPGVYCAGLTIQGNAVVTLSPGDYFFGDGEILFDGNATITGQNVGFFLYGNSPNITMNGASQVNISAREEGPLAGILFWWDTNATGNNNLRIASPNINELVGVIYMPSGNFFGDVQSGAGEIAEESAFTAIIAQRIEITGNTNLTLNTDYLATNVPVPGGIAGVGGQIVLRD